MDWPQRHRGTGQVLLALAGEKANGVACGWCPGAGEPLPGREASPGDVWFAGSVFGRVPPSPLFFGSADSKGLRARSRVSADSTGLKVLCFQHLSCHPWKCSFCRGYGRGVLEVRILKGLGGDSRIEPGHNGWFAELAVENSQPMVAREVYYVNTFNGLVLSNAWVARIQMSGLRV